MKRSWSRAEKGLLLTPLLAVLLLFGVLYGRKTLRHQSDLPFMMLSPTDLRSIALSKNGRVLAEGGTELVLNKGKHRFTRESGTVYLWNAQTWQLLRAIPPHVWKDADGVLEGTDLRGLAVSPDGSLLAESSGGDHQLRIYRTATGRQVAAFSWAANYVAFSPDGKTLAAVTDIELHVVAGKEVWFSGTHLYDVRSGKTLHVLPEYSGWGACAFSPDGKTLAVVTKETHLGLGLSGDEIHLLDVKSGKWRRKLLSPCTTAIAFAPDGKELASVGEVCDSSSSWVAGTLRLYNLSTGELLWERRGRKPRNSLRDKETMYADVAFSPSGRCIATHTAFGSVALHDVQSGHLVHQWPSLGSKGGSWSGPPAFVFSPDGRQIYSRNGNVVRVLTVPR